MLFCRYRHIAGEPGQGVHRWRLFGVALVDVVATVLAALLLARVMRWPVAWTLLGLFLAGVLAHRLFCVNTRVNVMLFGRV